MYFNAIGVLCFAKVALTHFPPHEFHIHGSEEDFTVFKDEDYADVSMSQMVASDEYDRKTLWKYAYAALPVKSGALQGGDGRQRSLVEQAQRVAARTRRWRRAEAAFRLATQRCKAIDLAIEYAFDRDVNFPEVRRKRVDLESTLVRCLAVKEAAESSLRDCITRSEKCKMEQANLHKTIALVDMAYIDFTQARNRLYFVMRKLVRIEEALYPVLLGICPTEVMDGLRGNETDEERERFIFNFQTTKVTNEYFGCDMEAKTRFNVTRQQLYYATVKKVKAELRLEWMTGEREDEAFQAVNENIERNKATRKQTK